MASDINLVTQGQEDFSAVAAPEAGDTWNILQGRQRITGGLNFSAVAQLLGVLVDRGFHGDIGGGADGPWRMGTTSTFRMWAGGGTVQIYPNNIAGGGSADTVAALEIDTGGKLEAITGGSITSASLSRGRFTVGEGVDLITFNSSGGDSVIQYDSTAITTVRLADGTHTIRRSITTGDFIGCNVTMARQVAPTSSGVAAASGITATTLRLARSTLVWHAGAITAITLGDNKSMIDWRRMPVAATIGTLTATAEAARLSGITKGATTYTNALGAVLTVSAFVPLDKSPEFLEDFPV
jgi:hypothetical protein